MMHPRSIASAGFFCINVVLVRALRAFSRLDRQARQQSLLHGATTFDLRVDLLHSQYQHTLRRQFNGQQDATLSPISPARHWGGG